MTNRTRRTGRLSSGRSTAGAVRRGPQGPGQGSSVSGQQDGEGIKVGDRVRARAGAHEGKVGTAQRVVETRDLELNSDKVLVVFNAGEADYLNADALEKAEKDEE